MKKVLTCNPRTTVAGFALYAIGGWHLIHGHQLDAMLMSLFAMGTGLIAAKDANTGSKCDPPDAAQNGKQ